MKHNLSSKLITAYFISESTLEACLCGELACNDTQQLTLWVEENYKNHGSIEHPRAPNISGVVGWNLGRSRDDFCSLFNILLSWVEDMVEYAQRDCWG